MSRDDDEGSLLRERTGTGRNSLRHLFVVPFFFVALGIFLYSHTGFLPPRNRTFHLGSDIGGSETNGIRTENTVKTQVVDLEHLLSTLSVSCPLQG